MDCEVYFPCQFKHKFVKIEKLSPEKFSCEVRVNLLSEVDFHNWLSTFERNTNTSWIVRTAKKCDEDAKFVFSRNYVCHHSSYGKIKKDNSPSSKNKNCNAALSIRIKKDTKYSRYNDPLIKEGLRAVIKINFDHSHHINVAEAWNWLRRSEDTKEKFIQYFNDGMSPSAALMYHETLLMVQEGPEQIANSRINPPKDWVYKIHNKWVQENFGGIKSDEDFCRVVESKLKKFEDEGCKVTFSPQPMCIAVVTPLMCRMLNSMKDPQPVFIDSSASCDQANSALTILLTATKAGAIPIGAAIHSSQSEESYTLVFESLSKIWPHSIPIVNFMTDDSAAMKNALKKVFPDVRQLLCQFHVPQALWRWLWNGKNMIHNEHRKHLMNLFRSVMYADNEEDLVDRIESLFKDTVVTKYENFSKHMESLLKRKEEWCLAYRMNVRNSSHNTNNYAEATFRIVKDIILSRLKAFNAAALLDFINYVMDKYYSKRLLEVVFGRVRKPHLMFQKFLAKGQKLLTVSDVQHDGSIYIVQSETDKSVYYHVDIGVCTCKAGVQGAFCKHQAAVHLKFNVHFPNAPELQINDKMTLFYIATDNMSATPDFFQSMSKHHTTKSATGTTDEDHPSPQPSTSNLHPTNAGSDALTDETLKEGEEVLGQLSSEIERLKNIYRDNMSDSGMVQQARKFIKRCQTVKTSMQLYAFFQGACDKSLQHGRRIKVQPTSVSRRKEGVTKGCLRRPAGRPRGDESQHTKRKRLHSLASGIELNQPNAKKHGDGH